MTGAKETPATRGGIARGMADPWKATCAELGVNRLPPWARKEVENRPCSGNGFHPWLFRAALALYRCRWKEDNVRELLQAAADQIARFVPTREIEAALCSAAKAASVRQPYQQEKRWTERDEAARKAIAAAYGGVADLWEESPLRPDETCDAEWFIDALFPADALLCVAGESDRAETKLRGEWRGQLNALQFIVPNPMSARRGRTDEGNLGARTKDNTGPRRFLVIESDSGTSDEQAAVLLHLAEEAPLTLALLSGGKSLHGWFYCRGIPEERLYRFMRRAVRLGADYTTFTSCQLVRLPEGYNRKHKQRQRVLYFAPETIR